MRLSTEDVVLFYKLYKGLLFYTNNKLGILPQKLDWKRFQEVPYPALVEVRDALHDNLELIDSFVEENPRKLSDDELEIVRSWKDRVKGQFLVMRHLKNYTVFMGSDGSPKAYGVLGLIDEFEEVIGPELPQYVRAVLLPFKGKIVYDGLLTISSLIFGGNIRRSLNASYQEAKARYGIITSLPVPEEQLELGDAELLRFYLKSQSNREMYADEIRELVAKSHDLLVLYHQEMGKAGARVLGKQLRQAGVKPAMFAILEGLIIASGRTGEDLEKTLRDILPAGKRELVYVFKLQPK